MARAFTDDDLIQFNTGIAGTPGSAGVNNVAVTLPVATTDGNTVLVFMRNVNFAAAADVWDIAVQQNTIPSLTVFVRIGVPAGETSWTMTAPSNSVWAWRVEEWANVAALPYVSTSSSNANAPSPSTLSTGNTSSFTGEQFVMAIALFSFYKAITDSQPWPTIGSFTNGFTSVDVVDNGDGTSLGAQRLAVARYYGTENQVGPLETTATFTGDRTNVNSQCVLAVLRAADTIEVPAPVVLTVGALSA